ncbi:MAG TPA: ABC transporter substrate-binding protein [Acidimicrobiia bacterium]|nr:ABC transporter substrate-binding protein [Acidimicrobiia bacterium]
MRLRWCVLATALVLVVTACGGGSSNNNTSSGDGLGGETSTTAAPNANCKVPLTASEVGVSPTTITVTVIADVNNSIRPGLFKGSWDGMKAWGDYINSQGGLACRRVVVKQGDSKLSPTDATNAVSAACGNSIAMVGTTALFLQQSAVTAMEGCKDKAGASTGIPDIADLQTEVAQQCSKISFATLPTGSQCPYSGTGLRKFRVGYTQYDYYFKTFGASALHGVFTIPKDLPSTISASTPIFRAENRMGIKSDAEFGKSGTAIQTDYTEVAQAIKSHGSTYARNGLDYKGTVLERKEAQVQGVSTVKVWDCSLQCYDKRLIQEGGNAVDGQYVWLNLLPFEDKGSNPTLDGFLKYDKTPDGFGAQAFIAGEIFARAVDDTLKANNGNPNSITRANILKAVINMHDFDANGMAAPGIDVGRKLGSTCLVGMQVKNGKFVRIDPVKPGTFDCDNNKPALEFTIDAAKEYKG